MSIAFEQYLEKDLKLAFSRDPNACHEKLFEVGEGVNARVVAKESCFILIPKRWAYNSLANIGDDIYITCIFAIVFPESGVYGVVNQVNRIKLTPDIISIVKIRDEEYFKFSFGKGSTVWPLLLLNVEDTLAYPIFDEIVARGNEPAYLLYDDGCKILKTAATNAGINLSPNNIIIEMTYATISRDTSDRSIQYRMKVDNQNYQNINEPAVIGLRNVQLGPTNFVTRTAGSYFETGIESSLVNPSMSREGVEDILRI